MNNLMTGKNGGFMLMIFSVLGMVLGITMFETMMTYFTALAAVPNASAYIAYSIGVEIAPTLILLTMVGGAMWANNKGYGMAMGSGVNGLLMIVMGALEIILFLALFPTIMAALEAVRTMANISSYIGLQIVVEIVPIILLLAGLFSGGRAIVGGAKSSRSKSKQSAQTV